MIVVEQICNNWNTIINCRFFQRRIWSNDANIFRIGWLFSFKYPPYQWNVRASQWTPANSFATVLYLHIQGSYIAFWGLLTLPENYTICYSILRRVTMIWSVFWSDSDSGNERCQASAKFTPCARDRRRQLTEIT